VRLVRSADPSERQGPDSHRSFHEAVEAALPPMTARDDRFTWQQGDLTQDPEARALEARRLARQPGGADQGGPRCQACGRGVVASPLCDRCAKTIDRDTEALMERPHYDDLGFEFRVTTRHYVRRMIVTG
jgi:hypothetical protein